jgi:hypothetical protein
MKVYARSLKTFRCLLPDSITAILLLQAKAHLEKLKSIYSDDYKKVESKTTTT